MKIKTISKTLAVAALLLVQAVAAFSVVRTDSIRSTILGEWVKYNVYYPESYDGSGRVKYPVLYLLHGLSDNYNGWNNRGHLGEVADELLRQGKIREMIIVMPNAGGPDVGNVWNGYFNMPGWSYEDFFFKELMPTVETKYNAGGGKAMRAISGLSMGGGGSTVYSLKHPELFSSCYAMSAWLGDNAGLQTKEQNKFAYLVEAVRKNAAADIVANASEEQLAQFRSVKWYFDVGDDDSLLELSEKLHLLMRSKRIKARLIVREGNHNWIFWNAALYNSLPFASDNFEK